MAIERIYGGLWIPMPPPFNTAAPAFVSMLMDASAEKVAFIIRVPKTGTLDKFEFRIGASAQLPANGLKCSFQDVKTGVGPTGDPDGTIDEYRVVTGLSADSWVVPGLITSDGTDTGTKRSVARGDLLSCVIQFESFSASDVVNVSALDVSGTSFVGGPPYSDHYTTSWAKQTNGPIVALKYDDGTYEHIVGDCYPIKSLYAVTYNSEIEFRGMTFSLPSDVLLGGVYARVSNPTESVMYIHLVGPDLITMETILMPGVLQPSSSAYHRAFRLARDHLLRANEFYRLILEPGTPNNITLYEFDANSTDIMAATEGGQSFYLATGIGGVDTTRRPWMGLIITGIDHDISGGSGGGGFEGVP